jgi:hypothetical protein
MKSSPLGSGGVTRDTRLGRSVAIQELPADSL